VKGTQPAETLGADLALRALTLGHGAFYVVTGVWPFASRRAFERVTGPKTDWWLVQTVGIVVTAVGLTLCAAGARRRRVDEEMALLAIASSLGLASMDIVHVARGRLRRVYLGDAAAELMLAAGWLAASALRRQEARAALRRTEPTTPAS
jgi:hypothetical protein